MPSDRYKEILVRTWCYLHEFFLAREKFVGGVQVGGRCRIGGSGLVLILASQFRESLLDELVGVLLLGLRFRFFLGFLAHLEKQLLHLLARAAAVCLELQLALRCWGVLRCLHFLTKRFL